jgi:hypothetical protein
VSMDEHRRCLGLGDMVTVDDIHRARRRLALRHHPDRGGDPVEMARINRAADELLSALTPEPESRSRSRPQSRPESATWSGEPVRPRHIMMADHPSFTIDVLPVEAHEALTLAVASLGEIVDEEVPYMLEFTVRVDGGESMWCRADIVPDAGASTVSIVTEARGVDDVERLRDCLIREINRIGFDR